MHWVSYNCLHSLPVSSRVSFRVQCPDSTASILPVIMIRKPACKCSALCKPSCSVEATCLPYQPSFNMMLALKEIWAGWLINWVYLWPKKLMSSLNLLCLDMGPFTQVLHDLRVDWIIRGKLTVFSFIFYSNGVSISKFCHLCQKLSGQSQHQTDQFLSFSEVSVA